MCQSFAIVRPANGILAEVMTWAALEGAILEGGI